MKWDDVVTWEILDPSEPDDSPIPQGRNPGIHCLCGRFGKWVGDQHYYNGNFDCYRYTVRCSRCGDVDIECV